MGYNDGRLTEEMHAENVKQMNTSWPADGSRQKEIFVRIMARQRNDLSSEKQVHSPTWRCVAVVGGAS